MAVDFLKIQFLFFYVWSNQKFFKMSLVRSATLSRKTNETDINVTINLDSARDQIIEISSGIGFLDHVFNNEFYHFMKIDKACYVL